MSVRPPPPLPPAPETPPCSDLDRLHDDCRRGHTAECRAIIGDNRALVNQEGNLGFTALQWAAQSQTHSGHTQRTQTAGGGQTNLSAGSTRAEFVSPVLCGLLLCPAGHVDIVELLLHEGAAANAQNHNGDTALHLAVWKKHALVVAVLLNEAWKANLELKNHEGKTAEQMARTDEIRDLFVKQAVAAHPIHMAPPEEDDDGHSTRATQHKLAHSESVFSRCLMFCFCHAQMTRMIKPHFHSTLRLFCCSAAPLCLARHSPSLALVLSLTLRSSIHSHTAKAQMLHFL